MTWILMHIEDKYLAQLELQWGKGMTKGEWSDDIIERMAERINKHRFDSREILLAVKEFLPQPLRDSL